MNGFHKRNCPKCVSGRLKYWRELTDEQKLLAEKLPLNTEFSHDERKKHRFCDKCWFETAEDLEKSV